MCDCPCKKDQLKVGDVWLPFFHKFVKLTAAPGHFGTPYAS